MTKPTNPSHADIVKAARQARAEALRDWMSVWCASLMNLFGSTEWDWKSWRRE